MTRMPSPNVNLRYRPYITARLRYSALLPAGSTVWHDIGIDRLRTW